MKLRTRRLPLDFISSAAPPFAGPPFVVPPSGGVFPPLRRQFATSLSAFAKSAALLAALVITCHAQGPASADGWVVLGVDDYRALREAAFPREGTPPPPPVEATLSRIDYDLKVDGDLASGEARLTVDVIKDGWVRVAVPAGLMVREAHLDGRQISLVTEPGAKGVASSYVLLSRTGRSVLALGIVAPVSTIAGTDILRLPIGASAVSRASVVLARQGVDMHITGGLLLERSEAAGESRWVAHGRAGEGLTFAWKRKIDETRSTQPLRLRGSLTQLVGLGEDATQVSAEVRIEVTQGVAKECRLQLPAQFQVNQVSGASVADWQQSSAAELTVTFIEPVQQSTQFTLSGEVRLPRDGQIDVPLIRLPAAERESGGVAVEVLGAGEIKGRKIAGMAEAEAGELGQLISSRQSPSLIAFRLQPADGKSARSLSLGIARYTPQSVLTANIEEADYSVLISQDGKMLVYSRLAVRNNQRSFLKLNLPAGSTLWSASVAGRPIRPGSAPDGSFLLPLQKSKTGEEAPAFVVEVVYLDHAPAWSDKGRQRLALLALDMPISKSRMLVHYSPLFRLNAVPGAFRVAPYEAPISAVLRSGSTVSTGAPMEPAASPADKGGQSSDAARQLVSQHQQAAHASAPARNLPIRVAFPHFGPSIFLISELTSENQTPVMEFDYQRDRKRGER
jgi:hypothetical protein